MVKPEFKDKSIRSFVIRGGRITEGQEAAFKQWWPVFGRSLFEGLCGIQPALESSERVIVEIGFGMGDSLLEMALADPNSLFIGIEVHPPGVGRLINEAGKREIKNLLVFMADANDVLEDCFPDSSIDRVQLFFPDPWHKKKHHKRRIVQTEFIEKIASKLKPEGIFHMATDWQPYAESMTQVMSESNQYFNVAGAKMYSDRPSYRPHTKFEQRGERLGHGVWDLLYKKQSPR